MGDVMVLTPARDVVAGDYIWRNDDLYRVFAVTPDPNRHTVTICLEACRWGDWTRAATSLVPVERMT